MEEERGNLFFGAGTHTASTFVLVSKAMEEEVWWVKKFMKLFRIRTGEYLAALWSVVAEARTAGLSLSGSIPPGYPKAGYTLVEVAVEYEVIDRSDFGWPCHEPVVDALLSCGAEATMSSVEDALRAYRPSLFKTLLHALGETPSPVFIGLWLFYIPECEKYGHFDMPACSELIRVLADECPMALDHAREALLGAIQKPSITLCSACSLLRRTNPSCTYCKFFCGRRLSKLARVFVECLGIGASFGGQACCAVGMDRCREQTRTWCRAVQAGAQAISAGSGHFYNHLAHGRGHE